MAKKIPAALKPGRGNVRRPALYAAAAMGAAAVMAGASNAHAATIIIAPGVANGYIPEPSGYTIGTGGDLGSGGYQLFDFNASTAATNTYPTYVTSPTVEAASFNSNSTFSTLTVNSQTAPTGIVYILNTPGTIMTFTLGSGVPTGSTEIQLGLLDDNAPSGNFANDCTYVVSDISGGHTIATVTTSNLYNDKSDNDFYLVDIQNASVGDVISIYANRGESGGGGNAALGGVTFDTVPFAVPEPTALGLLALSTAGLLTRRRRGSAPADVSA